MKRKVISTILAAVMAATTFMAVPAMAENDFADKKVGICMYTFADNFMTLYRTELERYLVEKGFDKANIQILDGNNDQATQSGQINNLISDKVDVLIINMVTPLTAEDVTDRAVEAGIPLVYINREPSEEEEARWAENNWDVTYVGADARQSGTMQGEIIVDLGLDTVDLNGNGKVDYVMIEGDPENVDAQFRTEFSIKALTDAGIEVNAIMDEIGMWDQTNGYSIANQALASNGADIEVIFCNNDAMALGALEAIEGAGRKVGEDIFLVGVDALVEALNDVIEGRMTGTVFNDHIAQAQGAADAAINYITGAGNEHYIGCDYVKATAENAADILALLTE
jgi:methyl-galactoside transport system substrate-binding protein